MSVEMRLRKRRRRLLQERNNSLYKKARLCSLMLILVLIIVGSTGMMNPNIALAADEPEYEIIIVRSGDTVWEIADKYNPNNMTVRKYANEICKLNNIENYTIYPGQAIKLIIH